MAATTPIKPSTRGCPPEKGPRSAADGSVRRRARSLCVNIGRSPRHNDGVERRGLRGAWYFFCIGGAPVSYAASDLRGARLYDRPRARTAKVHGPRGPALAADRGVFPMPWACRPERVAGPCIPPTPGRPRAACEGSRSRVAHRAVGGADAECQQRAHDRETGRASPAERIRVASTTRTSCAAQPKTY
jgi:hypothetical protein